MGLATHFFPQKCLKEIENIFMKGESINQKYQIPSLDSEILTPQNLKEILILISNLDACEIDHVHLKCFINF